MFVRVLSVATFAGALSAASVAAQPSSTVSSTVARPGQAITINVSGQPGQSFAVLGSSVGGGFSHAGVPLSVGADVVILRIGVLDASGQAAVAVTPPFAGTVLDRYYLQAVTAASATFTPPQPAPAHVIRNGDLARPTRVRTRAAVVLSHNEAGVEIPCAPGEQATGGGGMVAGLTDFSMTQSMPVPTTEGETPTGWYVSYRNGSASDRYVYGFAICAVP